MSTRTTGKRETLEQRIKRADFEANDGFISTEEYIRAELQRVARQVRRLDDSDGGKHKHTIHFTCGYYQAIHDVLELLKEAGR